MPQIDDVLVKICTGPLFDNGTPFITYGCVLHLSSERGIIRTFDEKLCLFELKDLNMDGVVDMTDVLPLGCTLKFFATRQNHHTFTASNVSPICEPAAQLIFLNSTEMNVITPDFTSTGSSNHYSVEKERFAYVRILELFQQQAVLSLPLSSMISELGKFGEDDVSQYIGISDEERGMFIKRRTHLFTVGWNDLVTLQSPDFYQAIVLILSYILCNGGVTSTENVFEFYQTDNVPLSVRQRTGSDMNSFREIIDFHSWAFTLSSHGTYVSAKRNLPHFDYMSFFEGIVCTATPQRHQKSKLLKHPPGLQIPLLNTRAQALGQASMHQQQQEHISNPYQGYQPYLHREDMTNGMKKPTGTLIDGANQKHCFGMQVSSPDRNAFEKPSVFGHTWGDVIAFNKNSANFSRGMQSKRRYNLSSMFRNLKYSGFRSSIDSTSSSDDSQSLDNCSTSGVNNMLIGCGPQMY